MNLTVGTVTYATPEQLMGLDGIDGRTDQYALAATACHLLTGSQLFPSSNPGFRDGLSRDRTSPFCGPCTGVCGCRVCGLFRHTHAWSACGPGDLLLLSLGQSWWTITAIGPESIFMSVDRGPERNEDGVDSGTDVSTIGPTQLIAVGFKPRVDFVGAIIEEIDRLEGHGVLRLLDVLVLTMDDDGSLTRVEIADEDFGDLLIAGAQFDPFDVFAMFEGRGVEVLQSVRAQALVQSLVPGSGLALILVEHRWARRLFDSIAALGGVVFSEGFIGEQTENLVGVQLAALEDTARVIDEAYAAQTEAVAASAAAIEAVAHKADEAAVAASVSAVELQVLRYLPTKMTFALVADKLGISRSAAKERAERAYKKLGVHNRADAVTRARELGLIRHPA